MEETEYRWLPHLEGAVPPAGQGKRISTYTISLEGWRRGLILKFYSHFDEENRLKIRYSLENEERKHHFSLSMGDKVSDEAFVICDDKELTKQHLSKENVPVPQGRMFPKDATDEEIITYGKSLGFPLVVKPTNGNAGKGVFANIQKEEELKGIVEHVRHELGYPDIIVETYVAGEEFRICVIENRVLGAMNRRPTNIVGDGTNNIKQLIDLKNKIRKMNPHLTSRLIKIDREVEDMLRRAGYTLDSVPADGELVYLREKSNLSAGGDAIDVTEKLTPELEKIAIDAGKAIPGLTHYGVDMIVDKEKNTGVILEVNARPGFGGHLFPMEGKPRDFAKEVIDYYFPETKDIERTNLYFDFDNVILPLKTRVASEVQVSVPPIDVLYGKRYVVSGNVQGSGYRRWIRKNAMYKNIHGSIENLDDGKVEIILVSTKEGALDVFKEDYILGYEDVVVTNLQEFDWNKPVQYGFEIIEELPEEVLELEREKEKIELENQRLHKKYSKLMNSRIWRYTSPVRYVLDAVKRPLK
jgi:D-alanine-D-alanine ligase-like ATP-grasp enzyme/acylphosphatase